MDALHAILIPVHAIAATFAVLIAPVNILRRRRDAAHRALGRSWVVAMYLVCVSGMFIYTIGGFTIFHALALFTFATTTLGVLAIRRRNVRAHAGNMIGSWAGALVAGGFAAFVPGREIPTLAVSDPAVLWSIVAAVVVLTTAWVAFVLLRLGPAHGPRRSALLAGRATP